MEIRKFTTNVLTAVLKKIGKNYEELSPQAKATFGRWEKVLNGKPMTVEKLSEFLKGENENILAQLLGRDIKYGSERDIRLKSELNYGRLIVNILSSPEKAAKNLEIYLRRVHNLK